MITDEDQQAPDETPEEDTQGDTAPPEASLEEAVAGLDPENDDHWNKAGSPDLNHLKEALGRKVSKKDLNGLDQGSLDRDQVRANRQAEEDAANAEPAVDPNHPVAIGRRTIDALDELSAKFTGDARRLHGELGQVFQGYQAERPSIIERQKRLEDRYNRG